jgi:hypothetical protein
MLCFLWERNWILNIFRWTSCFKALFEAPFVLRFCIYPFQYDMRRTILICFLWPFAWLLWQYHLPTPFNICNRHLQYIDFQQKNCYYCHNLSEYTRSNAYSLRADCDMFFYQIEKCFKIIAVIDCHEICIFNMVFILNEEHRSRRDYLDLRERRWQENVKHYIMRTFITFPEFD